MSEAHQHPPILEAKRKEPPFNLYLLGCALVAALGGLAGAGRYRQCDITGENPAAWLETAGKAGGTVIEVTTTLAVRAVPGGTLAAGPAGERAVIGAGQQPPPGWRWVTDLDDDPGEAA